MPLWPGGFQGVLDEYQPERSVKRHIERRTVRGDLMNILTANLLFSTLVFWMAARIYVFPKLDDLKPRTVLLPILLLHSFRRLGLMFLAPGATYAGIPPQFAYPAAFGDLLAALLAIAAILAVVKDHARQSASHLDLQRGGNT